MYNFIDVEASGFGAGSYPIEVGVALASGTTHCTLICPPEHWNHWQPDAERLHGISRDKLLINGRSPLEAALRLNEWLDGEVVYSDAWGNDSCWLGLLFDEAGVRQRFRLESIVALLDAGQIAGWHSTKDEVQVALSCDRHRASNDAKLLQQTVSVLQTREYAS